MSYITTTAPALARGEVRDMYQRQQAAFGYVPNYAKVFSARPRVMQRWGQMLAEIRRPVAPRTFELATFAAARALGHGYCSMAHGEILSRHLGTAAVSTLARDGSSDSLEPGEQELVQFAALVAADANAVSPHHIERLRELGASDEEIFDVAAIAAARSFFCKLLQALGAEPDGAYSTLDGALLAHLPGAEAISRAPDEMLEPLLEEAGAW